MHHINKENFNYFVGLNSGIKAECPSFNANIEGAFKTEKQALKFAATVADSLNFVMIYNSLGKTVHAFGPDYAWSRI